MNRAVGQRRPPVQISTFLRGRRQPLNSIASRIFSIVGPGDVTLLGLEAAGADMLIEIATRAGRFNLPSPRVRVPDALEACRSGELDLVLTGSMPNLRAVLNGREVRSVVPGPGSGWAFLLHSELMSRWIESTLTFLWIALLVFPFGLWARRCLLTALGAMMLVLTVVSPALRGHTRPPDVWDASAAIGSYVAAAVYRRMRDSQERRSGLRLAIPTCEPSDNGEKGSV